MIPGFSGRLEQQIKSLAPPSVSVKVSAHPERMHGVWLGATVVAAQDNPVCQFQSKQNYQEQGPKTYAF